MTKLENQIIAILKDNNFTQDAIEEVVVKSNKQAIITIETVNSQGDKKQIEKDSDNAKKAIISKLDIDKVTIILTINQSKKQETKKSDGVISKVKNIFQKDNVSDDKKERAVQPNQQKPKHKLPNVKHIVAIASAKGGVGKSSLAANIAITLAKIGHKTALVDADIYGPSIAYIMNVDDNAQKQNNKLIPHQQYGVKFISVANLIAKDVAGVWRAAMINKILNQLILQTDWSHDGDDVDVMIVDMPPGTGDIYLSLAQNFDIDGAVLVSTPQVLSQIDLIRSIDCFEKLDVKILGLIENMSYFTQNDGSKSYIFGKSNLEDLVKMKNIDFMGRIEIISQLSQSNHDREPLSYGNRQHPFSHQIGMICEDIISKIL